MSIKVQTMRSKDTERSIKSSLLRARKVIANKFRKLHRNRILEEKRSYAKYAPLINTLENVIGEKNDIQKKQRRQRKQTRKNEQPESDEAEPVSLNNPFLDMDDESMPEVKPNINPFIDGNDMDYNNAGAYGPIKSTTKESTFYEDKNENEKMRSFFNDIIRKNGGSSNVVQKNPKRRLSSFSDNIDNVISSKQKLTKHSDNLVDIDALPPLPPSPSPSPPPFLPSLLQSASKKARKRKNVQHSSTSVIKKIIPPSLPLPPLPSPPLQTTSKASKRKNPQHSFTENEKAQDLTAVVKKKQTKRTA